MGLKMTTVWALSVNVNTKFRLVGPWKWEGARDVMEGEIWETITRRRAFFGHFTLSAVPIVLFGMLNAVFWIFTAVVDALKYLLKLLSLDSD